MSLKDMSRIPSKRLLNFGLLLMFVVQLTACKGPTTQDLVGTWRVDYGKSKLTLTLRQDGTFEQVFETNSATSAVRRTGRWQLTDLEGPSVELKGALFVEDQTGVIDPKLSAAENAGWVLHVNQTFGHLSLTVNQDLGLYFERSPH